MKCLPRFSCGVGGGFAHHIEQQLAAFERLAAAGVVVAPVWSAARRQLREAAARAVTARRWQHPWFIAAGHIRPETTDGLRSSSDFFTIDVADSIGKPSADADIAAFVARHPELGKPLSVPGITKVIRMSENGLAAITRTYLFACRNAGQMFWNLRKARGADVVVEVSMTAANEPQTPPHLLVILALLAEQRIPLQAIALNFKSLFHKSLDDVGKLAQFEQEFSDDVAVCAFAARTYGLPKSLKLSVDAGRDMYSLYPVLRRTLVRTGAGVHLKTAGTTRLGQAIDPLYRRHLAPLFLGEPQAVVRHPLDLSAIDRATSWCHQGGE